MNNISNNLDYFFKSPNDEPIGADFSYLYLLRRDILTAFGYNPNTMEKINYQVLWPGVMSLLAGIDLLGKFFEGDDSTGKVGCRFRNYYNKYFDNKTDNEIIYQLRNSLLHSFGLYSFKRDFKTNVKTQEYFFVLAMRNDNVIVTNTQNNTYLINIIALLNAFEISIGKYYEDIKKSQKLQENFEKIFNYYNGMHIQQ